MEALFLLITIYYYIFFCPIGNHGECVGLHLYGGEKERDLLTPAFFANQWHKDTSAKGVYIDASQGIANDK